MRNAGGREGRASVGMPGRGGRVGRAVNSRAKRWLGVFAAVVALAGCTVEVRGSLPPPVVIIPSPGAGDRHDLALVSLAFDPPLHTITSITEAQQVQLVAVVDNRGTQREERVVVTATLRTLDDGMVKGVQTATIAQLAPGEVRAVRFGNIEHLAYAEEYAVTVRILPVAGETNLDNNEGTLFVTVR